VPAMNQIEQELWARIYATEYERLSQQRHTPLEQQRLGAESIVTLRELSALGANVAVQALRVASCNGHEYADKLGSGCRCKKCGFFELHHG
jgi:hypothetical protein